MYPDKSTPQTVVIAEGVAVTMGVAAVVFNIGRFPELCTAAAVVITPVAKILVGAMVAA